MSCKFRKAIGNMLHNITNKQIMLFCPTPIDEPEFDEFKQIMTDPVTVDLTKNNESVIPQAITHQALFVAPYHRDNIAIHLLNVKNPSRAIVFTTTETMANSLARFFKRQLLLCIQISIMVNASSSLLYKA